MYVSICKNIMRLSRVTTFTVSAMLALATGVGPTLAQDITNNDDITTGILTFTADTTITNNGSITLSAGQSACAITAATGSNITITNTGSITTTDTDSSGICAPGSTTDNINITNAVGGTITTSGAHNNASGIQVGGANSAITNNGAITTTGSDASGISTKSTTDSTGSGADIRITNAVGGTITTTGQDAYGINSAGNNFNAAAGSDAILTNAGTITTAGAISYGIFSNGADATITNSGSITTTGQGSHAIRSNGAGVEITNSGSITTTGAGAHGIVANGDNATITISETGVVSATGTGSFAVKGSDAGDQRLVLLPNSSIIGLVDLGTKTGGGDNDVIELRGSVMFDRTTATGIEDYEITGVDMGGGDNGGGDMGGGDNGGGDMGGGDNGGGDMIVTLDPTGSSATRMALGATMGHIHRQVSQRLAFASAPQVTQGAGAGGDRRGWGTFFGSRSKRGDDGMALAWKHNFQGLVLGYDADIESGQRVGLFAGFGRDKIRTSKITSITDTASRGFFGIYGQHVTGNLTLNGALVLGHASHKSTRTVLDTTILDGTQIGTETASGSYNSTTISPSPEPELGSCPAQRA